MEPNEREDSAMTGGSDHHSAADPFARLIEMFVFAPVGFALAAPTLLPELVEKGRVRVEQQVRLARTIGRFVVPIARRKGEAVVRDRFADLIAGVDAARRAGTRPEAHNPAPDVEAEPARTAPPQATPGDLSIEGYDSLPASSIVGLLDGLAAHELREISDYERRHRGRRTILAKTDQLLADQLLADQPPTT